MRKNEYMHITHTTGAILAGGSSNRMGRDKASLVLEGESFLERTHTMLSAVLAEVTVHGGIAVPPDGVLIPDEVPGEGPVGGLLTAMQLAHGRPVFVTSVDTPMLTAEAVRMIVEPPVPSGGVRVASVDGRIHPLIAVYGPDVLMIVRQRFDEGKRSMMGVIDDADSVVEVEIDPDVVFNVNTEADYQQLIERYGV
jgi:molybdopterin-guanine dinucleotide biosynthesis protein A